MRTLTAALALVLIFGTPLAQGEAPSDETRTTLRQELLRLVNRDRKMFGLGPVQLDIEASLVADRYCVDQIRNRTNGHFDTRGQSPYMRYSFAGGNDGISENTAAWSAPYAFSVKALLDMTRRSQAAMMAEVPPHDGHRRTILDPHATHVGIGLAWEKGEFRVAQEFVRRYVTWTQPLPRHAALTDSVTGGGKPLPGSKIEAITVHHEPLPQSMPAHVANALTSYSLPDKRRDYLPLLRSAFSKVENGRVHIVRQEYQDGTQGDFPLSADGSFTFTVPFNDGPGIYTVVVWIRKKGEGTPVAASNVSIRVQPETVVGTR